MLSKVLDLATPTLRDIARMIGMSYHSVRAYRLEARTASPAVRQKLARALRAHAKRLERAADELDATAERDT